MMVASRRGPVERSDAVRDRPSPWRVVPSVRHLRRQPALVLGAAICLTIALAASLAPLLTPYDPARQDIAALLEPPSWTHPFGTDDLGRDLLSRLLFGARISYLVAVSAALTACVIGSALGLAAGFFRGWTDLAIMRVMDALFSFPALVLAIAIVALLGPGIWQAVIAITIVAIPRFARLMRAQTLAVRDREYATAALVIGATRARVALRHVLPNAIGVVIIQSSTYAGFAVLSEASLSFLGLGVQPPTPAWGSVLKAGYQFLDLAPWLAIFPGAAISLLVLGFNLLGDGLRDLLDPRSG